MIKKSEFARRQRLGYDEVTRLRIEVTRGNDANQRPTTNQRRLGATRSTEAKRYILKKNCYTSGAERNVRCPSLQQ